MTGTLDSEIDKLISRFEGIRVDRKDHITRIFGADAGPLDLAKCGADDLLELAYDTSEHHPYWIMIYRCAEIAKTLLEKWDQNLTKDELDEMQWAVSEMKNSLETLSR